MHVTHDLDEALALADRLAVLIDGSVRQTGLPDEVVRYPADSEVARLFGAVNVFSAQIVGGEGDDVRIVLDGGGLELVAAAPAAGLAGDLCAVIRAEEIELLTEGAIPAGHERLAGIAAQNLLEGIVHDVRVQSVHASVEIEIPPVVSVHVLRPEVRRLDVSAGGAVRLYVPPGAIHLCTDRSPGVPPFNSAFDDLV
jgi:ABC-type Fe3+/spermidine/putrescine transport system ATPase subunit